MKSTRLVLFVTIILLTFTGFLKSQPNPYISSKWVKTTPDTIRLGRYAFDVKLTVEFNSNSQDTIFIKTQKKDTTFNTEFFSISNNFSVNYTGTKFILKANHDSVLVRYYIGDVNLYRIGINKSQGVDTVFLLNTVMTVIPPVITSSVNLSDTCSAIECDVLNRLNLESWSNLDMGSAFKWTIISDSAIIVTTESNTGHNYKKIVIPAGNPYTSLDWWSCTSFPNLFIKSLYGGLVNFHLSIEGR